MVYNSLTFQKEEFKTITQNEVLMYVCGPTVYDSPHLGHAKSAVAFDLIRRYLKFKGYNVKLVKNYTDIDDKIIKRANERNMDFNTLSEQYIKEYEDIMALLNIERDFKNPRATEVIDFMIEFIEVLIAKGYAYEGKESVYFSVKTFDNYKTIFQNVKGDIEEEEEEEYSQSHIEYDEKRDHNDFALWKKSKEGEPFWESPWGKGRPGWHIECSAMSMNYLADTIDIHGGGQDLKFPHHRNEIAQSEGYSGKKFANYFIHNGFVNIDNEKMSKSLNNFFLVSDVAKEYEPMVIRLFLLSGHYRKSVNYSLENMTQSKKNYEKLINTIQKINDAPISKGISKEIEDLVNKIEESKTSIMTAMDDDFDTPVAVAEIMTLFRFLNRSIIEEKVGINAFFKEKFFSFIEDIDKIFGIFPNLKAQLEKGGIENMGEKDKIVNGLLDILKETRTRLRAQKLYDISDYIRDKLAELGLKIEDN